MNSFYWSTFCCSSMVAWVQVWGAVGQSQSYRWQKYKLNHSCILDSMIHKNISDCWTLYVSLCCIMFVIPSGPKWSHFSRPDCPADRIPEQKVQTLNTFSYFFIFPWVIVNQYININQYIRNSRYDSNVPLVLMNSFNTDEDTMKIIRFVSNLQISSKLIFHQNQYLTGNIRVSRCR